MMHTLVDITRNGSLAKTFPFTTPNGEVIENKESLRVARRQNSNFETILQLLQIRGNITWEDNPIKIDHDLGNTRFGKYYEGHHTSWHFTFYTEQSEVFGMASNPTEQLAGDFNLVPMLTECKETAHFPIQTFITANVHQPGTKEQKVINALSGDIINTYFSYGGWQNK